MFTPAGIGPTIARDLLDDAHMELHSPHLRVPIAAPDLRKAPTSGGSLADVRQGPWRSNLDTTAPPHRPAVGDRQRRILNVMVAGTGVLVLMPLMILIAISIKLTSRGPILYGQNRVGLDRRTSRVKTSRKCRRDQDWGGKFFRIYKFRTMLTPKQDPGQVWAQPSDPRIIRLGAILRRYRLDELPQLFNVLVGDMNVVGPRPEQPEIFLQLRSEVDRFVERQRVLPGITGWAQVNQRSDQCLDDVRSKVGLDLEYIRRRSPSEDLRIMARTLPVMMKKPGGH